jgi:hypothetical protein
MELLLGEKYQIVRMIAVRRQSTVYEAILKEKPGKSFAAKIERVDKPNQELYVENKVLKRLGNELELPGIPRVHAYQVEGRNNVLVTDLVDSDLEELRNACGGQFSLKTVLMLGEQILKRIEQTPRVQGLAQRHQTSQACTWPRNALPNYILARFR